MTPQDGVQALAKSKRPSRVQRDLSAIANSDELLSPLPATRSGRGLLAVEDRRTFYPSSFRPAVTPRQVAVIIQARPKVSSPNRFNPWLSFKAPESVAICIRRARRKQVLHAKGVAGFKKIRRRRRTAHSSVSCKR